MSEAKETNDSTPENIWIATYTASQYAGVLSRGLLFRSIHNDEEEAQGMRRDPQVTNFTVTKYVKCEALPGTHLEGTVEHPVEEPARAERCSCGAWICQGCLSCSSDCGCADPKIPCDCWFKDKQVCDICQGVGGSDLPAPKAETVMEWALDLQVDSLMKRVQNQHTEISSLRGELHILRESEKHRLELLDQFTSLESSLSLAGCVKDTTNPVGSCLHQWGDVANEVGERCKVCLIKRGVVDLREEEMTDSELDEELIRNGIDPSELHQKMRIKLIELQEKGCETSQFKEMCRQFAAEPAAAPVPVRAAQDSTNPCGWSNKRAEEAEAELESLKETVASLGITSREYASHLGPAMMWQNSLWQAAQSELDEANAKIAMLESSSVPQDAVIATVKAIMAEIEEWDEPMTHKEIYKVINNIFPATPYLEQPKGAV